jgi:competence protein ComEC
VRNDITPAQWKIFQATGTNHLIAISGLHIGLVAMLFFNAVKLLVRRSMLLTNIAPASFYGAIAAMLGALMYAALAGFSISTQRALIMVVVGMGAILLRRPVFSTKILALAWWGVFIWDPLAPLQMGFWLSFGCVSALLLGQSQMVNLSRWRKWLLPQWIVFIGLLPASVLFFQQIPLLSVLANAILIPLVSFVVVPLSLVAVLFLNFASPISQIFLELAHGALSLGWEYLRFLTKLPMSVYQQGYSSYLPIFLASIGAFLLLLPKGLPVRWLGWLGLLPLFFTSSALLTWGECRFTLLDVGQGLAAVIQTRHHTLLYDAGPQYGSADAGGRVIIPFLRTYNISNIDKVIISHGDLDHRAGLASLKNYSLGEVITSEPGRLTIASKLCEAPSQWEWEGVQFRLLSPTDLQQKNRNNLSCVLKVTAGEHSILLTGDIEKGAEKQLVALEEDALKSSILVVPHHGSLTSSSDDFIRRVLPQYALYPVGLGNHYGFPKQAILERYQAIGSQNLIVFETGALIFHLKPGNELTPPIHWRETSTQYWHVKQSGG